MATKIVTKNSSTASAVPTASDLVQGELAVNVADKRLFTEDNGGSIVELGTNPSTLTVTGEITANGGIDVTGTATMDGLTVATSADPATFTLRHTGNTSGFIFKNYNGNEAQVINADNGPMVFKTNDTERMRIDSSGRVGIGVSPNAKLEVQDANGVSLKFGDLSSYPNNVVPCFIGTGTSALAGINGDLVLCPRTSDAGKILFATGQGQAQERLRIDSSGNIQQATSVNGDLSHKIYNANTGTAAQASLYITNSSANADGFFAGVNGSSATTASGFVQDAAYLGSGTGASGGLSIMTRANADMRFYTNGHTNERMRLDSSGATLVNTTSKTNAGTRLGVWADSGSVSIETRCKSNVSYFPLANYSAAGSYIGGINATTTGTSLATSSDQRLKENIADADDAGSKIDAIQVRQYDWKADGSHQDYGMIAQELREIIPNVIHESPDEEKMLSVDYAGLVPMLIKEIQSLRNRVAQLEE